MSYCPRCGNKVEDTMTFCPNCAGTLKEPTPQTQTQPIPTPTVNPQIEQNPEKNPKTKEKGEHNFMGYLIIGLVLIVFGAFSVLNISGGYFSGGTGWTIMLVLIGIIIIGGALYTVFPSLKRTSTSKDKPQKKPEI